jgi:hypothetical protein
MKLMGKKGMGTAIVLEKGIDSSIVVTITVQ